VVLQLHHAVSAAYRLLLLLSAVSVSDLISITPDAFPNIVQARKHQFLFIFDFVIKKELMSSVFSFRTWETDPAPVYELFLSQLYGHVFAPKTLRIANTAPSEKHVQPL
jgi:hypothetical protein